MNFRLSTLVALALFSISLKAQDTLKVTLREADSIVLKKNFLLLASSMNIDAQKAQIIQSKAYPNPVFTAELNAYDPENNKTFHLGPTGQKAFQLEQLILLGGKHKMEIDIAKTNSKIAELEFHQLLRQIKFRLHSDLFAVGQLQVLLFRYNAQLNLLETLLSSYETQAEKGNIPMKDVVRLKGAYLKLNKERATLLKDFHETQSSLQTLLQTPSIVAFEFSESDIEKYIQLKVLDDLKKEARENRPDIQISQTNKILAAQYYELQKRQAFPDVTMITSYDQRGGAYINQMNVGFSIPLPFWNRNQGNIQTYKYKLQEADFNLQAQEAKLYSELQNGFMLYTQTVSEYQKAKSLYNTDFEITIAGMTDNFKKRNVSIIEFIDFFEAYNEVLNETTRIKTQLVIFAEQINLLTGTDIY